MHEAVVVRKSCVEKSIKWPAISTKLGSFSGRYYQGRVLQITIPIYCMNIICDRVCIKGPIVGRYETEISAVKVNWSILVGFREILQSGSLLHKEAVDSHFKLISKLESSRNQYFSEQIKGSTCRTLKVRNSHFSQTILFF